MILFVSTIFSSMAAWRRRLFRRRLPAAVLGLSACGFLSFPAAAQESSGPAGDVFSAVLGHSITTDSNLFRRPDSANPRADTINATSASLRIDKPYSQQRFQLEITETLHRYRNSSYLDFDATSYRGAWLWSPLPWLNASFSADRAESLALFEDTLGTQRNVSIHENRAFKLNGRIFGGWNWLAGISRSDQKREQAIVNQPDQRTDSAEAGISYLTRAGNSIAFTRHSAKGDYLNQSAAPGVTGNSFREDQNELKGNWKLSEKSGLTGRVARLERKNDQIGQRNFSGLSGDLGYAWQATGKLHLKVSIARNTAPLQDPSFSYSLNDTLSFAPVWKITEKTAAHLRLTRSSSEYRGEGVVAPTGPARKDVMRSAELGVDWQPMRKLSCKASLQRQRRSSNNVAAEYDDNIGTVSASWMF